MIISKNRGLTLLETLFAIGILTFLLAITFGPLTAMKERQKLDNVVEKIESVVQEARTNAISSVEDLDYGVHFETSQIILFKGSVFISNDSENKIFSLGEDVSLSDISLAGNGSDVVFNRLKGDTDNSGVITISVIENPSRRKVLTIFPLGTFFVE